MFVDFVENRFPKIFSPRRLLHGFVFCFFNDVFFLNVFVSRLWLLDFSSSWLLGFLAFRLLVGLCGFWWLFGVGFSHPLHSQFLFGRWRFGFCGFSLVYAAFGGFRLSHPLLSQFFWLLYAFICFWLWLPASSASPVPLRQVFFTIFVCVCLHVCMSVCMGGAPPTPPLLLDL